MPQPSRSLLPLRVIRDTPCAPVAPAACVPAAPPLRRSARAARHCPPLVGGQLPAGRPVTPGAGQSELCGARRLAPELRTFGRRGCNRGVLGVLRVPALRSRVSARNRNRMRYRALNFQCVTLKRSLRPGPLRRPRVLPEKSVFTLPSASPPIWKTTSPRRCRGDAVLVVGSSRIAFRVG